MPGFSLSLTTCLALLCILPAGSLIRADDWPTYRHDKERSGKSADDISPPLFLRWSHQLPHPPRPAWPLPAKQDYWNEHKNLRPRVVYDRANGIVAAQGIVICGSSSDDQVRAFDLASGKLRWRFVTEGPVRLAPSLWEGRVVFGCDDGCVYGLRLETGEFIWKTRPTELGARRIPGNGRIISERPIRSGVLIDAGAGFFTAGIFPQQGAYFFSIDVRSGRVLDKAPLDRSVQGYLEYRNGRIFGPTGRDRHGVFLETSEQGEASDDHAAEHFCEIATAALRFQGREQQVVALSPAGNIVWAAEVEGRPYDLAIANGSLLVSTDAGWLYRFAAERGTARVHVAAKPDPPQLTPASRRFAHRCLQSLPSRNGYALCVEPDPELPLALATDSALQVVVVERNRQAAAALRDRLQQTGLDHRVAVHVHASLDALPYGNDIFNLVCGGNRDQVLHLICPEHGVAFTADGQQHRRASQPRGEWTHTYANPGNTASTPDRIGSALQLQWFGGPGPRSMVDRHMRTMPPLAIRGRMFVPGLDRMLAVDAFNGTVLWEKSLPRSTRIGILKDCGWLAVDQQHLYVAFDHRCVAHHVADGTDAFELEVPVAQRDWGYLARVDGLVVGSTTLKNAARRTINRDAILEGAYSDRRPVVCSDGMFAFDAGTKSLRWSYASKGAILNPTIAAAGARLVFLENQQQLDSSALGRMTVESFLDQQARLVALDLQTAEPLWSVAIPAVHDAQNLYVLATSDHVVLVNSRNDETVHYDVRVVQADSGQTIWSTSQDNGQKVGGDHGEQDKHPLVIGERLIVEPFAYQLTTGRRLADLDLGQRGGGCGTLSGSATALFFRSKFAASYQLDTQQISPVTTVSRPGCWINMIPASGLLLIPEGSSGCTCDFPVQTSMAFRPLPAED